MKILLIAHPYLNLYKSIAIELERQGHKVTVLEESQIKGDPYYKCQNKLKRIYKIWRWETQLKARKYWINKIKSKEELNKFYDILFVIQGCTFDVYLLEHLKRINSNIKSSLYIWDTNRMYDFFRNAKYFDKVYSFDYKDVENDKLNKTKYLPFFWVSNLTEYQDIDIKYKISSIGTNHDDRYFIFKKIISKLKKENVPYYIKLILSKQTRCTFKSKILYLKSILLNKKNDIELYKLRNGIICPDFIEFEFYNSDDLCKIMAESESILDTDNELQYGTTPRLIWAIALNKHIFTTNSNIINLPFYNKDYIHIINRNNPKIDWDLLKNKNINSRDSIEYLRIDNWVKNFIY